MTESNNPKTHAWVHVFIVFVLVLLIGGVLYTTVALEVSTGDCGMEICMTPFQRHNFVLPDRIASQLIENGTDTMVVKDIVRAVTSIVQCRPDDLLWSFWVESKFEPGQCLIRLQEPTRSALGLTDVPIGDMDQQMRVVTAYFWSLRHDCGIRRIRNFSEMRVAFVAPYLFGRPDTTVIAQGDLTRNQRAIDNRCDSDRRYTLADVRCEAYNAMTMIKTRG